ncbi:MAG: hypothetical protein RRY22_04995 [Bacilli bacterium]
MNNTEEEKREKVVSGFYIYKDLNQLLYLHSFAEDRSKSYILNKALEEYFYGKSIKEE